MIKSVIDIGTNTAHILIAEVVNNEFIRSILRHRVYTYLGENGLTKIHAEPLERLYKALHLFEGFIKEHDSKAPTIIATDALRSASNGPEIQIEIRKILNAQPFVISGTKEAQLIRRGVELSLPSIPKNYLIMDIGGGSVEFIHVVNGTQMLLKSLPLGISRLYEKCKRINAMDAEMVSNLKIHIKKVAWAIIQSTKQYAEDLTLIGSAGTFEIFLPQELLKDPSIAKHIVDIEEVRKKYEEVLFMEIDDRKKVSWLPSVRSKYIVVALILMQTIIEDITPQRLIVSKYALKEGAIVSDLHMIHSDF